jgi:exopolysaccharide production protein ExoQ
MHLHLPPQVALLLTVTLIVLLFRRDIREKPNVSSALWLPVLWLVLCCSKPVSEWFTIFGLPFGSPVGGGGEESPVGPGTPVNAYSYLVVAAAGLLVLIKRQVDLSKVIRNNRWVIAFFLYCFISIAWCDFPSVAFKRWIKIFGHPIIALIVLTEPDPEEAVIRLMKRCAYVVVPVSILFIKYYLQWGVAYDPWSGMPKIIGIAAGKNLLGEDLLILGVFFFWHLLQTWQAERNTRRRHELGLIAGFSIGIAWLFLRTHSATSVIGLFVAALLVVFVGTRFLNKNFIGTYMLAGLILIAAAELAFGLSGQVSEALGRGSGLSGRTKLWTRLLELHTNPIIGTGFESFWLVTTPELLEGIFFFIPDEAHNGYLEIYLDLGLIGVFLLVALLVATFWKIRLTLFRNFEWGRYQLGLLAAVVLYNWTEAAFKTHSPIWFVFYIIAMKYPRTHFATAQPSLGVGRPEESGELAYAETEA